MTAAAQVFQLANPHALASIVDASATRKIVASQDIFDDRGTKLWARDQRVSHSLHQRLLERKLRQPLETCLRAEDGVTPFLLDESLQQFLFGEHVLAAALQPMTSRLIDEVHHLVLHPSVQLLLTAAHASRPHVYEHAVRGMALAGALQLHTTSERYPVRMAMLGGLLHDLGEMYVNPAYLQGSQPLDIPSYRHVITHPRVGELLLATLTDYPGELARAVGEHHERLDGSGYPQHRSRDSLSPLGRLLVATETALGLVNAPVAALSRMSMALRLVGGEHEDACVSFFADAASRAHEDVSEGLRQTPSELSMRLSLMSTHLDMLQARAAAMSVDAAATSVVKDVARKAAERLHRLRTGWNSVGLWSMSRVEVSSQNLLELSMVCDETTFRLTNLRRDCLWPCSDLLPADSAQLEGLWGTDLP